MLHLTNISYHLKPRWRDHIFSHTGPTSTALNSACTTFGISWEALPLLSPNLKFGPATFHPAARSKLNVSLSFDFFCKVTSSNLLVCTDGSKHQDTIGSGLVIFKGSDLTNPLITKTFSLPSYATVYNGESEVLIPALILLLELHDKSPFSAAHFYLDNHATLMNLTKPWASTDSTIHRIYSLSKILPFPISFTYVPAHKGHHGNELADTAAKAGHLSPNALHPPIPKCFYKRLANTNISSITQDRWNSTPHDIWLISLFPTGLALQSFLENSKGLLHTRKLASGRYPLRDYLFSRSYQSSPICPHCDSGEIESAYHRVITCQAFQFQRNQMILQLGFTPSCAFEILQSNDPCKVEALNKFLIACFKSVSHASLVLKLCQLLS